MTVSHTDEDWNHYADRWEVLAPDGSVLATRVLRHPHVDQQPFTRELANVEIPGDIPRVTVRARDSEHAYGGAEVAVTLPDRKELADPGAGTASAPSLAGAHLRSPSAHCAAATPPCANGSAANDLRAPPGEDHRGGG